MRTPDTFNPVSTFRLEGDRLAIAVFRQGKDGNNRDLQPIPQPRGLATRRGKHVQIVSVPRNSTAYPWKMELEEAFQAVASVHQRDIQAWVDAGCALEINMTFLFKTKDKKRLGKLHMQRPDGDNLAKLVLDSMTTKTKDETILKQLLIRDDNVVSRMTINKVWSEQSGVLISIRPLDHTTATKCITPYCRALGFQNENNLFLSAERDMRII